jgi:hypothetical protein
MVATLLFTAVGVLVAFAAGFAVARRGAALRLELARGGAALRATLRQRIAPRGAALTSAPEATPPAGPTPSPSGAPPMRGVRFDPGAPRGTRGIALAEHAPAWREAMRAAGDRLAAANVGAVVFVHGTFAGTDPLSAYGLVERALPGVGRTVARRLRKTTRVCVDRLLGDLGNFGPSYVRLFEGAIGGAIPCTTFVWSSENHHVGRLEGALALLRVLATHAELAAPAEPAAAPGPRILVLGHSHAGQVFALVTQLLAQSIATEAVLDVARVRGLDVGALTCDLATLDGVGVDFVTFGAPARYAWATVPEVRTLHVLAAPGAGAARPGDWIQRLGGEGSDFPPLAAEDRRVNAALAAELGGGFAPSLLAQAVWSGRALPEHGEVVFVDYGAAGVTRALASGLGHGVYTRLDAMLFHAQLVTERLYPKASLVAASAPREGRSPRATSSTISRLPISSARRAGLP